MTVSVGHVMKKRHELRLLLKKARVDVVLLGILGVCAEQHPSLPSADLMDLLNNALGYPNGDMSDRILQVVVRIQEAASLDGAFRPCSLEDAAAARSRLLGSLKAQVLN